MRPQMLSYLLLALLLAVCSSQADAHRQGTVNLSLERRVNNEQYIINPCPEFNGYPIQYCQDRACGGDTKIKGVCDNIRLNGLQDQRCRFSKDCGDYCRCKPDRRFQSGPAYAVQCIQIMCPQQYGLPMMKCSDPRCGGDVYDTGICDNVLVSGCQGPGCPKPGCGIFCQCDPTPDPSSTYILDLPTANVTWLPGTETLLPSAGSMLPPTGRDTAGIVFTTVPYETAVVSSSASTPATTAGSLSSSTTSTPFQISSSTPAESNDPGVTLITQSTGPIWEPTVAPEPTTSGGMIIPIIPIIPLVPPPAGFVPPPPGTPEPTEQCPADYQETKCGDCGGEFGWCQHPPSQGCPCEDACTTGDDMPDCNDNHCEGQDSKCTVGPQKDCECKTNCPEGINDIPDCDDTDCDGSSQAKCTTGQYAGCDCVVTGDVEGEMVDISWAYTQQQILNLMAINAPNGAYSSLLNTTVSLSPTNSTTMLQQTTTSMPPSATTSAPQTCWTVRSYTLCIKSATTTENGHVTIEAVTSTIGFTNSTTPVANSTASITSSTAAAITPTPSPTSSQPPDNPPITTPKPTGPTYGVYIALYTNTITIPGQQNLPPQFIPVYNDLIWATVNTLSLPTSLQYCNTGTASTITLTKTPTIYPPFPTASITSLQPDGTSGPSCDWIPGDGIEDNAGRLSCKGGPTSVACGQSWQAKTSCGNYEEVAVSPLIECIWPLPV